MITQPDWSVLDLDHLPDWPDYASATSSTSDGQRGIVAAAMTPPNAKPVKVWLPVNMPEPVPHKVTDQLVQGAVETLLRSEAK